MKQKKSVSTYAIAMAAAAAIALLVIWYEIDTYGYSTVYFLSYCSDGFFTSAVFFIGFGLLTFISEAGNFYGIQYLGYMVVCIFPFRRERFAQRKDYFTYCTEKKAQQKDRSRSAGKYALLYVGLGCLALSLLLTFGFYQVGR
ncbi:MAG: DUF3899 domain-containing protein [Lachnospiraceae bacterium]|nr:DUF3899 domain-containing protein [Lachnospiraceae bacterium]